MRYGVINASEKVNAGYMDLDMREYSLRDRKYSQILLNQKEHTLKWKDGNGSHSLKAIQKCKEKKRGIDAWQSQSVHVNLMKQLIDIIGTGSTVMFTDVKQITDDPEEMLYLYECFVEKGIHLEFLHSSWLDTSNFYTGALKDPTLTRDILSKVISNTYKTWRNEETISISADEIEDEEKAKKNRNNDNHLRNQSRVA